MVALGAVFCRVPGNCSYRASGVIEPFGIGGQACFGMFNYTKIAG